MSEYGWSQLGKAVTTAESTTDPDVRSRAVQRARRWMRVLSGMATGRLRIGSALPVDGFPAWITPEVVRGGFVTGVARAGGPLEPDEIELASRLEVAPTRTALFTWYLSDDGIAHLQSRLALGDYRIDLPEHGALLANAYLRQTGRLRESDDLVDEIRPWSDQLRFSPRPSLGPELPGLHVATVPDVAERLEKKRPRKSVEAEREALTVWLPFADEVVAHWLEARGADGEIGAAFPEGWMLRAEQLVLEYRVLAATHHLTTKHSDPKGNLQIALDGLRSTLNDDLDPAMLSRVRHAVSSVVARWGEPGSAELRALRDDQARIAARPSHASLAHDVALRLRASGADTAVADPIRLVSHTPGAQLTAIQAVVRQATQAPLPALLEARIVRSAEMVAVLAPQLTSEIVEQRYIDPVAGRLARRIYLAFGSRRSLLLLNHSKQVTVDAVPWFSALEESTRDDDGLASAQALHLATLVLRHFPGTPVPNSIVRELVRLLEISGQRLPLTYELAADIFMGSFSPVFQSAAQRAATVIGDSLYSDYFDIDYPAVEALEVTATPPSASARRRLTVPQFDALAHARAGVDRAGRWPGTAENGSVIEQAQILTTHNLAALVDFGVLLDWPTQARAAWATTRGHLAKASGPTTLHHRKNAAYAWRQVIFYLALSSRADVAAFLSDPSLTAGTSAEVRVRCEFVLEGLRETIRGSVDVVPFTGWVVAERS